MSSAESGVDTKTCIGIGLALGIVFGVALHSYAFGILIGIVISAGLCLVRARRQGG